MTFPEQNNLEIWKPIPRYENYEISSWGRVKNSSGKILKPGKNKYGYLHAGLCKLSKRKTILIHRLVASAFLPNPKNLLQINHIDGNKENNNIQNLEWCNASDNIGHAIQTGLTNNKGENHSNSKLTEIQILEIRRLETEGWSQTQLAEKFGVSSGLISKIKKRQTWTHI